MNCLLVRNIDHLHVLWTRVMVGFPGFKLGFVGLSINKYIFFGDEGATSTNSKVEIHIRHSYGRCSLARPRSKQGRRRRRCRWECKSRSIQNASLTFSAISWPERRNSVPDSRIPNNGQSYVRRRQKRIENCSGMRLRLVATENHLQS